MNQKDLKIIAHLRQNARIPLTKMSKKTQIPVSTIFDKIKQYEDNLIHRHTTLIKFSELGFNTRANVMIKVDRNARESVKEFLSKHHNINTVSRINNGFDYMFEAIFVNIKDIEDFMELLDQKFKLENKEVYYIVDDIKKEGFMSDPTIIDMVINNVV